jgi:hypothetical protein
LLYLCAHNIYFIMGATFTRVLSLAFIALICLNNAAAAQTAEKKAKKHRIRSVYFSWGYNTEWYTNSTVHIKQDALGENYDLVHVRAHDHKGWDESGSVFAKQLTIPQYNYRLGFYINEKQDLAIELNFDHTKYIITNGQTIHLTGTHDHTSASENIVFSEANGFYYYLNNGANFFLFNIVKRIGLTQSRDNNFRLDLTGKAGVGPVIPHVENSFFGYKNDPHFQIGGWNTGLETAIRATICRYGYLEFSQKVDYARYSNLKINNGTAKQNFGTYELILSIGFILPTSSHNTMFMRGKAAAQSEK